MKNQVLCWGGGFQTALAQAAAGLGFDRIRPVDRFSTKCCWIDNLAEKPFEDEG